MADTDLSTPGPDAPPDGKLRSVTRAVVAVASGTSVNPFDRSEYAKATNRGYGDAMGRGLELALTLAVMAGIGWLVDQVAGTEPLFTAILSVVGFVGISVKLWIGYDLEMRKHEDGAIWNRPATPAGNAARDEKAQAS